MRVYYALYISCVVAIIVSPGPPSTLRFLADLISCFTSIFTIIMMLLYLHRRNQGAGGQTCVKTFYTMILFSWFYMLQKELIISLMANILPDFTQVRKTS